MNAEQKPKTEEELSKKDGAELSEKELEKTAGGQISKFVDLASPKLYSVPQSPPPPPPQK
jgi:hypothetical protein